MKILGTGSTGNSYLLKSGKSMMLLDAGIKLIEIKKGLDFKVMDLSAIFVSHAHL